MRQDEEFAKLYDEYITNMLAYYKNNPNPFLTFIKESLKNEKKKESYKEETKD